MVAVNQETSPYPDRHGSAYFFVRLSDGTVVAALQRRFRMPATTTVGRLTAGLVNYTITNLIFKLELYLR